MNAQKLLLIGPALGTALVLALLWHAMRGDRSPGRARLTWAREPAPIEAIAWLMGALIMALAPAVGAGIAGSLPESLVGEPQTFQRQAVAQAGGYGLALVVGGVLVWSFNRRATERTGTSVRLGDLWRGAAGLALVAPIYLLTSQVALVVSRLINPEPSSMIKHETLEALKENPGQLWSWVLIGAAVIGAPIVEELTYRLCLQSFLRRLIEMVGASSRGREVWVAIVGTSGLFALTHLSAVPWSALPSLFVFGLALGVAYERTARLGVPMVMHALFNAANVAAVMLGWVV